MSGDSEFTRITLLGGFSLQRDGESVALAPAGQRLLALLALHARMLRRTYVAALLWAESSEDRALGSLRSLLWKLRLSGLSLVDSVGDDLELSPIVDVDLRRVTALSRQLINGQFTDEALLLVEPRFCCELLPGWYDDWVLLERERHRQVSLHALESLCEHLTATHRFGAAVLAGLAAVDREPLRESAHRVLIQAHLAEGNAGEALRRYHFFRDLLARELGLQPSPMLESLVADTGPCTRHDSTHRDDSFALTRS